MNGTTELRKVPMGTLFTLISTLEICDDWQKLMLTIPKNLDETVCDTEKKYTMHHVRLIENAASKAGRKCTEILFDEWGTSGKVRPTLHTLLNLLIKEELFRAADILADLLNEPKPKRPDRGPAAVVETDINKILEEEMLESQLNKMETLTTLSIDSNSHNINLNNDNSNNLPTNNKMNAILDMVGINQSLNNLNQSSQTAEVVDHVPPIIRAQNPIETTTELIENMGDTKDIQEAVTRPYQLSFPNIDDVELKVSTDSEVSSL